MIIHERQSVQSELGRKFTEEIACEHRSYSGADVQQLGGTACGQQEGEIAASGSGTLICEEGEFA
jgi:hypothetical protein